MNMRFALALFFGVIVCALGDWPQQPESAYSPLYVSVIFFERTGRVVEPGLHWPGVTNLRIISAPLPQAPPFGPANPVQDKLIQLETDHNVTSMTHSIFYRLTNIHTPETDIYQLNYTLNNFVLQFTPCSAVGFSLKGEIGTFSWRCHQFKTAAYQTTTPPPLRNEGVSGYSHPIISRKVGPNDVPLAYRRRSHAEEGQQQSSPSTTGQ